MCVYRFFCIQLLKHMFFELFNNKMCWNKKLFEIRNFLTYTNCIDLIVWVHPLHESENSFYSVYNGTCRQLHPFKAFTFSLTSLMCVVSKSIWYESALLVSCTFISFLFSFQCVSKSKRLSTTNIYFQCQHIFLYKVKISMTLNRFDR